MDFFNQRKILVLLLVLLVLSMASNVYLYFKANKSSSYHDVDTLIFTDIQGGMGSMSVRISKGLIVGPGYRFNVSIGVKLWDPYVGSKTYNFSFKLYVRSEQSDRYSDAPVAETTVVTQKDKDAMYVVLPSGNLTVTAPHTRGIYIYKVWFGTPTQTWHTFEFPILLEPGPKIVPNV